MLPLECCRLTFAGISRHLYLYGSFSAKPSARSEGAPLRYTGLEDEALNRLRIQLRCYWKVDILDDPPMNLVLVSHATVDSKHFRLGRQLE